MANGFAGVGPLSVSVLGLLAVVGVVLDPDPDPEEEVLFHTARAISPPKSRKMRTRPKISNPFAIYGEGVEKGRVFFLNHKKKEVIQVGQWSTEVNSGQWSVKKGIVFYHGVENYSIVVVCLMMILGKKE